MKQVIMSKYGPPDVLEIQKKRTPHPRSNQVLVKNYYSGINFAEIMARMRLYPGAPKPPTTLGGEGCGVVESIGKDVKKFNKGDSVMVLSNHASYSTHICSNEDLIMPLPNKFSFQEGAAFPVIYLTAYMMMFDLANFQKRETILIHGAGGGVGTAAVQLALTKGGKIIGTASKWKHNKLHEMGVEYCIDYNNENIYKKIMQITGNRGVDLVIDPIGSHNWKISYKCLAPMGKLIVFGDQNFVTGNSLNLFSMIKYVKIYYNKCSISLRNNKTKFFFKDIGHVKDYNLVFRLLIKFIIKKINNIKN